jgi:flavin reductase (DIM6/NTAB) family NADH-FMN oxidoreductase RutF
MEFRNALGCFATGVCLITVNDSRSGSLALTANSFSSVSLEPPLVLWNIQSDSDCFREYTECAHFGISVLCQDQDVLSSHYARKGNHTISRDDFETDLRGIPRLKKAVASFSCELSALHEAGDHHVVIGKVLDFRTSNEAPLLFHGGAYGRLASGTH